MRLGREDVDTIRADTEAFRHHPDCGVCLACALAKHVDSLLEDRERNERIMEQALRLGIPARSPA